MRTALIALIYYVVGAARIWTMYHLEGGNRNLLRWRVQRIQKAVPGISLSFVAIAEMVGMFYRITFWPMPTSMWCKFVRVTPDEGKAMDKDRDRFLSELKEEQEVQDQ